MCGLYTREINLKPYFLYIQHRDSWENKIKFEFLLSKTKDDMLLTI